MQFNPHDLKDKLLKALDKDQNVRIVTILVNYVTRKIIAYSSTDNVSEKPSKIIDQNGPNARLSVLLQPLKYIKSLFHIQRSFRPIFILVHCGVKEI